MRSASQKTASTSTQLASPAQLPGLTSGADTTTSVPSYPGRSTSTGPDMEEIQPNSRLPGVVSAHQIARCVAPALECSKYVFRISSMNDRESA
jgi:hypothetical protein